MVFFSSAHLAEITSPLLSLINSTLPNKSNFAAYSAVNPEPVPVEPFSSFAFIAAISL